MRPRRCANALKGARCGSSRRSRSRVLPRCGADKLWLPEGGSDESSLSALRDLGFVGYLPNKWDKSILYLSLVLGVSLKFLEHHVLLTYDAARKHQGYNYTHEGAVGGSHQ